MSISIEVPKSSALKQTPQICERALQAGIDVLRESEIHPSQRRIALVQEQDSVCRRLLHGLGMCLIAFRPLRLIAVVCFHNLAREIWLVVAA